MDESNPSMTNSEMTHHVYCHIAANVDLGRVGRLRTTGYGLEDGQAVAACIYTRNSTNALAGRRIT